VVGVIGHLGNPTLDDAGRLARACEEAGAGWLGLADAFWWRDVWLLLDGAVRATTTIALGPAVTNPYLRHPFQTVAALATLQELAGERVFLGLAAGGSEARLAADVDRRDAATRTAALVELVRAVEAGQPLDLRSGRSLEVSLAHPTILIAAARDQMLHVAGSHADQALLWATALSDLERVTEMVRKGAAGRDDGGPEVVWAPVVELPGEPDGDPGSDLASVAVYAILNAGPTTSARWGLGPELVDSIRETMVGGDGDGARRLVPDAVLDDLVLSGDAARPAVVAARARAIGADSIAVPAFAVDTVGARIEWAREVELALGAS
jgi:5,10-methylenetetrahydromethanopterin reductase